MSVYLYAHAVRVRARTHTILTHTKQEKKKQKQKNLSSASILRQILPTGVASWCNMAEAACGWSTRFPDWETGRLAVLWDSPTSHLYLNCFPEPYVFGALCKQQPKTTGGRRTSCLELWGKWEACQPHSRSEPGAFHRAQGQGEAGERMGQEPPRLHTL